MHPSFLEKIILISRIWRKKWFYSLAVEPLFKSVTGLNHVFQPILTVTIVTVNMGWNTGFSLVTDWNKCCSWLRVLKLNDWQGVCSSVGLDTNIFIGTSVLNCQTIKSLFLQILELKMIFFKKTGVYTNIPIKSENIVLATLGFAHIPRLVSHTTLYLWHPIWLYMTEELCQNW